MLDLNDKNIATILFTTIKELCSADKIVANYKKYDWYNTLAEILAIDGDQEFIKYQGSRGDGRVLSIQKPIMEQCPEPSSELKSWLQVGWDNYALEVKIIKNQDNEDFLDDEDRTVQYDEWKVLRDKWALRQKKLESITQFFNRIYRFYNTLIFFRL